MGWREFLKKFRLADIKNSLNFDQAGFVNVKVEHRHYHFHFQDTEAVRKIQEANITAEVEERIKEKTTNLLANMEVPLNALREETMKEVVISANLTTAAEVLGTINATLPTFTASVTGTLGPIKSKGGSNIGEEN